MRTILALSAAATLLASPALAEGVFGLWKTETNDEGAYLHVEIMDCDGAVCGVITENVGGQRQDIVGERIIEGMQPDGANEWDDGTIWAPDDDEKYDSTMELDGDVLTVSGCVLFGSICRSQDWTRVSD